MDFFNLELSNEIAATKQEAKKKARKEGGIAVKIGKGNWVVKKPYVKNF